MCVLVLLHVIFFVLQYVQVIFYSEVTTMIIFYHNQTFPHRLLYIYQLLVPSTSIPLYHLLYPPNNKVVGGDIGFTPSVRPSVCPSVRPSVRPSRLPCPLCNMYSSGWIRSILATNDHYHERVCRTQWPLTLTYIFKVIWPWLRKSCPLCSVYSSEWIHFIFSTNDHFH